MNFKDLCINAMAYSRQSQWRTSRQDPLLYLLPRSSVAKVNKQLHAITPITSGCLLPTSDMKRKPRGRKGKEYVEEEKISFASWWSVWRMVVIDLMPPIDYACQKFTYYSSSLLLAKPSSSTASTRWRCWQPLLFVQKVFFWHNLWYITKATPLICATGENASLWNDVPKVWKGETKAFNFKSLLLEDIKGCIESQQLCFAFAVGK